MSIWSYANPRKFLDTTAPWVPWLMWLSVAVLAVGLVWGFFFTPEAERFGSSVKIIYLHVPSALMAINAWLMMLVASLIWLIRRHHVSALAARAVGLVEAQVASGRGVSERDLGWALGVQGRVLQRAGDPEAALARAASAPAGTTVAIGDRGHGSVRKTPFASLVNPFRQRTTTRKR